MYFNLTKKPDLVLIAKEFFRCNYILSLALFFTITLIQKYIIKHQDMKTFLNNPIAISPLEVRYLWNQAFYFLCILFSNPLHYKVFINTFLDKSNFLEEADLYNLPADGSNEFDPYSNKRTFACFIE